MAVLFFAGVLASEVDGPVIGIDLGTTYSCDGVWKNEGVEITVDDQRDRTMPSRGACADTERSLGDDANNQWYYMDGSNWVSAGANDINITCTSKNTVEFFMTLHYTYEKSFKLNVKLFLFYKYRISAINNRG